MAFIAGLALFGWLDGPWLLVIPLLLLPDVSMLGYLGGPRLGALTYNAAHTWAPGLALLAAGLIADARTARDRRHDPRRPCRHGPGRGLRAQAPDCVPGHPYGPDRH